MLEKAMWKHGSERYKGGARPRCLNSLYAYPPSVNISLFFLAPHTGPAPDKLP